MRMSSIMRMRSGLMPWLVRVMTLLPLSDEADAWPINMKTESVSSPWPTGNSPA